MNYKKVADKVNELTDLLQKENGNAVIFIAGDLDEDSKKEVSITSIGGSRRTLVSAISSTLQNDRESDFSQTIIGSVAYWINTKKSSADTDDAGEIN